MWVAILYPRDRHVDVAVENVRQLLWMECIFDDSPPPFALDCPAIPQFDFHRPHADQAARVVGVLAGVGEFVQAQDLAIPVQGLQGEVIIQLGADSFIIEEVMIEMPVKGSFTICVSENGLYC